MLESGPRNFRGLLVKKIHRGDYVYISKATNKAISQIKSKVYMSNRDSYYEVLDIIDLDNSTRTFIHAYLIDCKLPKNYKDIPNIDKIFEMLDSEDKDNVKLAVSILESYEE